MNKKTKNIIFVAIVLLVIILAFFFYKNSKKSNVEIIQNDQPVVDNNKTESITTNQDSNVNITNLTPINNKEFNTAMDSARSAMLKSDYPLAIKYYNQAISYNKNDSAPYAGLYTVYINQKDWQKALNAVDQAIKISPIFGDYWNWKILVMDQGLNKSYAELKSVYDQGYPQVRTQEKVNLVTKFAVVSENRGQKAEAIKLWQKAMELAPERKDTYQAEIDRLSK
jgi:tetratricopeptide (TPR) repeat protein